VRPGVSAGAADSGVGSKPEGGLCVKLEGLCVVCFFLAHKLFFAVSGGKKKEAERMCRIHKKKKALQSVCLFFFSAERECLSVAAVSQCAC